MMISSNVFLLRTLTAWHPNINSLPDVDNFFKVVYYSRKFVNAFSSCSNSRHVYINDSTHEKVINRITLSIFIFIKARILHNPNLHLP